MIRMTLRIENNIKFVRGKKRAHDDIERFFLAEYFGQWRPDGESKLRLHNSSDDDLNKRVYE